VPDSADRCSICLRAFCVAPGETFRCPDVWFLGGGGAGSKAAAAASAASVVGSLGPPEALGDSDRTGGQWAAQCGVGSLFLGARHHRLGLACWVNGFLLVAVDALRDAGVTPAAGGGLQPSVVAWGALCGLAFYFGCLGLVTRRYKRLIKGANIAVNEQVRGLALSFFSTGGACVSFSLFLTHVHPVAGIIRDRLRDARCARVHPVDPLKRSYCDAPGC